MITRVEIDEKKSSLLSDMLVRTFDERYWALKGEDTLTNIRRFVWGDGKYFGMREILDVLGITIKTDKNTKRPTGIARQKEVA